MHALTCGLAAPLRGPEEPVQEVRHRTLTPGETGQERGRVRTEKHAAQGRDVQLGAGEPIGEHGEERAHAAFEQPARLCPFVQDHARVPGQGHARGIRVAPQAGAGEREAAGRVVVRLALEQEQEPIHHDQPLVPERPRELLPIRVGAQSFLVGRVVEHLLDEALDRLARLDAQLLGHAGLAQPGLVHQIGQGARPLRPTERDQQAERIGDLAGPLPVRVDRDQDLGVGPGWVGHEDAKLDAVGE